MFSRKALSQSLRQKLIRVNLFVLEGIARESMQLEFLWVNFGTFPKLWAANVTICFLNIKTVSFKSCSLCSLL